MSKSTYTNAQLAPALCNYYTTPDSGGTPVAGDKLQELLSKLPALCLEGSAGTLVNQIRDYQTGASLETEDYAILSFIDEALGNFLTGTDLDYRVECLLRALVPLFARDVLKEGPVRLQTTHDVFPLMDLLIEECMGWSEDLGILGDEYMDRVEEHIVLLVKGKSSLKECHDALTVNFRKEHQLYKKLETTLAEKELASLAEKKARLQASRLLNREMADQKLPLFTIFLLQGAWHEFLQGISIHYGEGSKEWKNAEKLTEALLWSVQPQKSRAKHNKLMQNLPRQITSFSQKLSFDTASLENALSDVEGEYENIRAGNPSEPCEFELLEQDDSLIDGGRLDADMRSNLENVKLGAWFLYDDKKEPEEKIARLRVLVNGVSGERFLFTNHNRRKGLQLNYGQMGMHLANNTIKPLLPVRCLELFTSHLQQVLTNVSEQNKKKKQLKEKQEQKVVSQLYQQDRRESLDKLLEQHKRLIALKKKRSLALRRKARQKLEAAQEAVAQLRPEAWVKLPLMVGTLTPAKLVAIIPGNEKYIFANRAGIKVAEYTSSQLSNMLVTENSEILDTGDEFQNVLSSVVVGLRQNRSKSYEELTGDTN